MNIDVMPAPQRKKTPTKNTQDDFRVLALIDIETTGSNFERDRLLAAANQLVGSVNLPQFAT